MGRERKDTGTEEGNIRVSSDEQYEMTEASSPLYEASEALVKARQTVMKAKEKLEQAEDSWIEEMKNARKSCINHKGDIIEYVKGKTTDDHARFKKS
jgi:hypothetical protein